MRCTRRAPALFLNRACCGEILSYSSDGVAPEPDNEFRNPADAISYIDAEGVSTASTDAWSRQW